MSFSIDWLDLREPADAAARDAGLIADLARWAGGRDPVVLDLGSGTGSSYRALAQQIGGRWTLTDIDASLLDEAVRRHGGEAGFGSVQRLDLMAGLEEVLAAQRPDIVTGSALIDLASADWLDRLAAALPRHAALYMALSYDGVEHWHPAPPAEAAGHAAFLTHQRRDKGFGPALGPDAAAHLADALRARGWEVSLARSDWRLNDGQRALITALADGAAEAVAETGALAPETLEDWRAARRSADRVTVGHLDLLALPRP